jgi:hypothetical protein
MGLKAMNMCYNSIDIFIQFLSIFNCKFNVEVGGQAVISK